MNTQLSETEQTFPDLLDVERVEEDTFRGWCHAALPLRAFGGQVAAQALVAAGRTVPESRRVHSLHSYFVRTGRTDLPIAYLVDRTRDGRSFATRRVTAVQRGEAIFTLSASFQEPEIGVEHQAPMPNVAPAVKLDLLEEDESPQSSAMLRASRMGIVLDIRLAGYDVGQPSQQLWVRTRDRLCDDPLLHVCALTYVSDLKLATTPALPHEANGSFQFTSLDHALWFHRDFRADEWLLFTQHSPTASSSRGLATGAFFTEDGRHVASVVQEVLLRPARA